MYTIILDDGTRLENLELNGNNYISPVILEDSVFEGNMANVTITDGTSEEHFEDMVLLSNRVDGGKSWIVLGVKSEAQKREEALLSKIASLEQQIDMMLAGVTSDE